MYDMGKAAFAGRTMRAALGVSLGLSMMTGSAMAATFTVTSTGTAAGACGANCNLRQAIDAANATTTKDTVVFNLPCGPRIINSQITLNVTRPIVIDGSSQPTCGNPVPGDQTSMIELRGPGVGVAPGGEIIHGISLGANSSGSEIKGLAINGFVGFGIAVGSNNNLIFDCKLGTDAAGLQARPNNVGLFIQDGRLDNDIDTCIVSGNQSEGILIFGDRTNVFQNIVGLDVNLQPMGNGGDGIHLSGANGNQIGFGASIANTIASNGGDGVSIDTGNSNEVFANKISSNGGLGVNLVGTGANRNQPAPLITSVQRRFQTIPGPIPRFQYVTTVKGTLSNGSGTGFRVDLYGNDACDSSGAGEGQSFLVTANVTSGAFEVTTSRTPGSFITAIARSPDGDSSEFSTCAAVLGF